MRSITVAAVLLLTSLGGCVSSEVASYHPFALNPDGTFPVKDEAGRSADEGVCNLSALAYSTPADIAGITSAGIEGGLGQAGAAAAATSGIVIAAGAAAGAGSTALKGLGLDASDKKFVKAVCQQELARRRGTYFVDDPILKGAN